MITSTFIALIAVGQRQSSFDLQSKGVWTQYIPQAQSSSTWKKYRETIDDKIRYLQADSQGNRLGKLKGFIEHKESSDVPLYAYMAARYTIEFQQELINNGLAPKFGYAIQNSYGDKDIEFIAVGYTALCLLKQSIDWEPSLGDTLLKYRKNSFPLLKAYVFEGIYCSKLEPRIQQSFPILDKIASQLEPRNEKSIRASLYERLYFTTKKTNYAKEAIAAWKNYLKVSQDEKGIQYAKDRIKLFESRIGT